MDDLAYRLTHIADGESHCAEFVSAVCVKQIGTAEVAVFEQVKSLNHIAERVGDGFGNREAEENQQDECTANDKEQVADGNGNAFVGAFNCGVRICVGFLLDNQNRVARRNGVRHDFILIEVEGLNTELCECREVCR